MGRARRLVEPATIPSREVFLSRLTQFLKRPEIGQIDEAWELAKKCHMHEIRESGEPYLSHPVAVAWILIDELRVYDMRVVILALLHDALEIKEPRIHITKKSLAALFGELVAQDLYALARKRHGKNKKEPLTLYHGRIIQRHWPTIIVKLVDRLHNMRTLHNCSQEKQIRIAKETEVSYFPLCAELMRTIPLDYGGAAMYLRQELGRECHKYLK